MIRWPLIEAHLQSTPWGATPALMQSLAKALRRSSAMDRAVIPVAERKVKPAAYKAFAANGSLTSVCMEDCVQPKSVAVIPVFGVIGKYLTGMEMECGGYDLSALEKAILQAEADPNVSSSVLHIVSPGGAVPGTPECASLISQVNACKPVYAYTDIEMNSCGYWLGSSGAGVFCSPYASIASVGVYLAWIDESKAMAEEGLELKLFKDGTFKGCTLPGQLTDEAGQMLQAQVNAMGSGFRDHVTSCRAAATGAQVALETMQGQAFLGKDAQALGLVDGIYRSLNDLLVDLLTN